MYRFDRSLRRRRMPSLKRKVSSTNRRISELPTTNLRGDPVDPALQRDKVFGSSKDPLPADGK